MDIDPRWEGMAALSNEDRKEKLSLAWLAAMASVAGFTWHRPETDSDSIDLTLSARGPRRPKLDIQMKATASPKVRYDGLHFRLKRKNYDDLREDRAVPLILVIVELPIEDSQWIDITTKMLVLRKRAWWASLKGEGPIAGASRTIVVPKDQNLDVNVLIDLMIRSREGGL